MARTLHLLSSSALLLAAQPAQNATLSLSDAVDIALKHNLALRIERTRHDDAQQEIRIAKSAFAPVWSANADSNFRLSPGSGSELDGAALPERRTATIDSRVEKKLPTGTTLSLGSDLLDRSQTNSSFRTLNPEFNGGLDLEIRQPLLKNSGFRYNLSDIRLAELLVEETNHQLQVKILELLRETEEVYWSVVAAEAETRITHNSIELSELIVEETSSRQEANLATETDVLEAKSSLAERQEALLELEASEADSRDRAFRILGVLLETDPEPISFENLPARVQLDCDPAASYQRALQFAPSMLLAGVMHLRRQTELERQRNQLRPQLDLRASTGLLGQDGGFSSALRSVRDIDGHFWDAGLEFRFPWGNRAERARLEQAHNALRRSELELKQVRLELYTMIRSACRSIELSRKRYRAIQVTLDFTERKLAQQRENYQAGEVTIRDVLEAQNDLDAARFRQLQARVQELNAVVQLAELEGTLPERYGISLIFE